MVVEQNVSYQIKAVTPKGTHRMVDTQDHKFGVSHFKQLAQKELNKPVVAEVWCERCVDGETDENGAIMKLVRNDGVDTVVLPQGIYHSL